METLIASHCRAVHGHLGRGDCNEFETQTVGQACCEDKERVGADSAEMKLRAF